MARYCSSSSSVCFREVPRWRWEAMEFKRTSEEEKQGWVNGIDDVLNCFHKRNHLKLLRTSQVVTKLYILEI
jgi:hypothetical protein